ncbi:hypothetical protein N9W11_03650 [Psychrosphaera haliotis]|nr:hypothetical protein [Psychrosphaera haliotis]
MQLEEAQKLKANSGKKPCSHPDLSKEYHLGAATGDFVCTACGEAGFGRDWVKREQGANKT